MVRPVDSAVHGDLIRARRLPRRNGPGDGVRASWQRESVAGCDEFPAHPKLSPQTVDLALGPMSGVD